MVSSIAIILNDATIDLMKASDSQFFQFLEISEISLFKIISLIILIVDVASVGIINGTFIISIAP